MRRIRETAERWQVLVRIPKTVLCNILSFFRSHFAQSAFNFRVCAIFKVPPLGFHGKFKPSNCLVDQRLSIRLTDFGMRPIINHTKAERDRRDSHISSFETTRNLLYLPPEVLESDKQSSTPTKSDIYAFSIVLHQLLFKCGPFWIGTEQSSGDVLGNLPNWNEN